MRVYEIFRSIQGETTRVGLPMWFVRLAGCDQDCAYCDTPEARDAGAGREVDVGDVLGEIAAPPLPIMITGGEPVCQLDEVNALASSLLSQNIHVLIETSGNHSIADLEWRASRILDLKAPGSGMSEGVVWENLEHLTEGDEVKFVLASRDDYDWAHHQIATRGIFDRAPILFSAARPHLDPAELARWMLEDALPVRLNLQIHRILDLP